MLRLAPPPALLSSFSDDALPAVSRDRAWLTGLVRELRALPAETDWVEFKVGQKDPEKIGRTVAALSNAAALANRDRAWLIWGIEDRTHEIVGTRFVPSRARKGNEPLEAWLARLLAPRIHIAFHEVEVGERPVVILEIGRATGQPVAFRGEEFIRVAAATRRLRDYPERARELWRSFDTVPFEKRLAAERVSGPEVLRLLDHAACFHLLHAPPAADEARTLEALERERLIARGEAGGFDITNLGAILLARRLDDFDGLFRKKVRFVEYRDPSRTEALREREETGGYAAGFGALMDHIRARLPMFETVSDGFRRTIVEYPDLAVRELLVNALIHQDFSVSGAGPMVELFAGRLEITNPGEPLVDPGRFIDSPPVSRNERLASLMRRFELCEERGSGIDRVVAEVERRQLPAPRFEVPPGATRVVLFARKELRKMDRSERIRATYQHACLKAVSREFLTNGSLRKRFGIVENNRAAVSRYIREAVDAGMIAPFDRDAAPRFRKYRPFWAQPSAPEGG